MTTPAPPAKPPTRLVYSRRPGVYSTDATGYSATGTAHRYNVDQTDRSRRRPQWMLRIFTLKTVAGITIADKLVATEVGYDSRALAYAIAQTYENFGEDYRSADHRHMTRLTAAITNAYADEQAAWQARNPDIQLTVSEKV